MLIGLLRPTYELPHVECAYAMYLIHVIAVWENLSQKGGKRSPPFLWLALGDHEVGGSNPLTPTINWKQEIQPSRLSREAKYESVRLRHHGLFRDGLAQ